VTRRWGRQLATLAIVLAGASSATVALAVEGDGGVAGREIWVALRDADPGAPAVLVPPRHPRVPSPLRVVTVPLSDVAGVPASACVTADGRYGRSFVVTLVHRTTGAPAGAPETVCVALPDPDAPRPRPPGIPRPPTVGRIWDATPVPPPSLGASPRDGVTGFETWLWASSPHEVAVDVTLSGYTVRGVARLTGYRFEFGDGTAVTTRHGGSADSPAARHAYERKGRYRLRVAGIWHAQFTMRGPGIAGDVPIDAAPVLVATTQPYDVGEIRAALVR
jgi:hypothetical protein